MDNKYLPQIKKIADTYGYDAQSRQCIEEMAELTQAINKFWRKELQCGRKEFELSPIECGDNLIMPKEYNNLVEEIADVQIMLWQMEYLLKIGIEPIIEQKIDRQIGRIKQKETEVQNAKH